MNLTIKQIDLIYRTLLGSDLEYGVQIINPFINGSYRPSLMTFVNGTDSITFYCFRASSGGGPIQLAQMFLEFEGEDYSYVAAKKLIQKIITNPLGIRQPKVIKWKPAKKKQPIYEVRKKFKNYERQYWANLGISEKVLKKNNVFSIKELKVNKLVLRGSKEEPIFMYLYPEDVAAKKFYRPKSSYLKFIAYNTANVLANLHRVDLSKPTPILESKKDSMVVEAATGVIPLQMMSANSYRPFRTRKINTRNLYSLLDPDEAGLKGSLTLQQEFGIPYVDTAKHTKLDFADYRLKYGEKDFKKLMKKLLQ